jgi:hypothetical protein
LAQLADDFRGGGLEFRQVLRCECLDRIGGSKPEHVYGAENASAVT